MICVVFFDVVVSFSPSVDRHALHASTIGNIQLLVRVCVCVMLQVSVEQQQQQQSVAILSQYGWPSRAHLWAPGLGACIGAQIFATSGTC
jgi:hypothetical protein